MNNEAGNSCSPEIRDRQRFQRPLTIQPRYKQARCVFSTQFALSKPTEAKLLSRLHCPIALSSPVSWRLMILYYAAKAKSNDKNVCSLFLVSRCDVHTQHLHRSPTLNGEDTHHNAALTGRLVLVNECSATW